MKAGCRRAVAEREQRLPDPSRAGAVEPDRAVVLQPAEQTLQRRTRIERHVVELQGLQPLVQKVQAPGYLAQRERALRRIAHELLTPARVADEHTVVAHDAA